jgi:hypothetical protein
MKQKIKDVALVRSLCQQWANVALTKWSWACQRNAKILDDLLRDYDKKVADERLELALTGGKGEVMYDGDRRDFYKMTKENTKKLRDFIRKHDEDEIEIPDDTMYVAKDFSEVKDNIPMLELFVKFGIINGDVEKLIEEKGQD